MIESKVSKIYAIYSGGQIGSDSAGLLAGHHLGLKTGGMAPKGFKTLYGTNPHLKKFGMIESESEDYKPRTFWNVKNSCGTIRFAYDFYSPGEICTLQAINKYKKPYIDINLFDLENKNILLFDVLDWFKNNEIKILNVAGNAGKNKKDSKYICQLVKDALILWIGNYNKGY